MSEKPGLSPRMGGLMLMLGWGFLVGFALGYLAAWLTS